MTASTSGKILPYSLAAATMLAVWEAAAHIIHSPLIMPFPLDVARSLVRMCGTAVFWQAILATFLRCMTAFAVSVAAGTLIGFLCAASPFVKTYFEFPVAVIRAAPVVSVILIALFWFTSSQVPVFVSVLMTLPVMISSVTAGFEASDKKLEAMARVYSLTKRQIFRWIRLPAAVPYFLSGMVSVFGLTWKVTAAGEVLSLPAHGAGTLMQISQVHLETADVAAVTFAVIVISFSLEKLAGSLAAEWTARHG